MEEKQNKQEKIRKVFLDDLPKWEEGIYKGNFNWGKSIGRVVHFIYNSIEGDLEIIDYDKKHLYIKYLDYDIFKINTKDFKNCGLGRMLKTYTSEFKYEIGQKIQDKKRDITIIDRKIIKQERIDKKGYKIIVNLKFYKYKCNRCGFDSGEHYKKGEYQEEYWIAENNITKGTSCPVCVTPSKIVVKGINDIATTNPELLVYFKNIDDAYKNSYGSNKNKMLMKCPECGFEKEMTVSDLYWWGFSCKKCGDGIKYPNKFAFNMLEQLQIDFETEFNPYWINPRAYDFYIPSMNLIIEMDGGLGHGNDNKMSGVTSKESKSIDDYKDELAIQHDIEVIRIDCNYDYIFNRFTYIKQNILNNKKLNKLFDLSKIDWNKCNEFATNTRVKEACEYKKMNPNLTTKDIGELMQISLQTVIRYLKQGSILNWCNYDPQKESIKSGIIQGRKNGKLVEIFKDGISLGIFPSCSELSRKSKKLFGARLCINSISKVCLKIQKEYKGFIFKYVE